MIKLCNKLEKNINIDQLIPMWSKIIDKYYEKIFNLGIILFKSILKVNKTKLAGNKYLDAT